MNTYEFFFEYNGNVVLSGVSNKLTRKFEILSGGDSSLVEWTDYSTFEPTENESNIGYQYATPQSLEENFIRIPTDITLDDAGTGVWLEDSHNGIRIKIRLTHNGTNHYCVISGFQKILLNEHGETVYQNMWASDESLSATWDSNESIECYLSIFAGYVDYKTTTNIPSILMQLKYFSGGAYTYASGTECWQINLFNPLPNPDHSYEPNETIRIGGRGDGSYPNSPAEDPNVSMRNTYMSFGSPTGKGLTYYITEIDDLMKAYNKIYSFSYINEEARLSAMIDAFKIPNLSVDGQNVQHFWIADINVDVNHAYIMTTRFTQVDMGTVDLRNHGWDDYNDFKNTRASLLLPFVGRINIDIHAIARGAIRVTAVLDKYTGNVAYWVYTTGMQSPREVLYGVYEGQSAIQIPFGSVHGVNQGGKLVNMATSFAGIVVGASSGNPLVTLGAGFAFGKSIASTFEVAVDKAHINSSSSAATGAFQVRLDIERREMLRPEQYREIASIPSFITVPLGQLTGFVSVHSTDCRGLTCEEEEKNAIKELLMKGVII